MPPLRKAGENRSSKLEEYFRKNCKTTAEVVDFIGGFQYAVNLSPEYATPDEKLKCKSLFEEYLTQPRKKSIREVDDMELIDVEPDLDEIKRRMDEYADYAVQLQIELAKEFKKQLSLVSEEIVDDADRNIIAMLKTRTSEAYFKYDVTVTKALDSFEGTLLGYPYKDAVRDAVNSKNRNYLGTLSEDEKKYYRMAMDAVLQKPTLLMNVKLDKVGITEAELDAKKKETESNLIERVDFNWASDKTMTAKPKFLSEQLSSDINRRYGRYYMSLEDGEKKDFLLNGMLENEHFNIYQKKKGEANAGGLEKVQEYMPVEKRIKSGEKKKGSISDASISVGCLSKEEKRLFRKACNVYFSPIKEDGSPDEDLFVERVDAIIDEIARLKMEHAKFIQNDDNFKDIFKEGADTLEKRKKAARFISPYEKKIKAYELEMYDILSRKKINVNLKKYYIEKKTGEKFIGTDALNATVNGKRIVDEKIQEVFASVIDKKRDDIFRENDLDRNLIGDGQETVLSDKEMEAVRERANSETFKMLEEHRNDKPWLNTGKDINLESLRKMNNLYEQFKNEDRIIYINSEEYTELKKKLKAAADMYKEVSKRADKKMSSTEKVKMESAFDAIHDAALKYIEGKEKKARKSDHGQNRYEIAFAALGVAYKGVANRRIEMHNIKHILNSNKTLSINDLMERGKRTVKEQKAYEKTHKPREKQQERRSSLASIKI